MFNYIIKTQYVSRPTHLPVSSSSLKYERVVSLVSPTSQPTYFKFGLGLCYSFCWVRLLIGYCTLFICSLFIDVLGLKPIYHIYYSYLLYIVYCMLFIYSLLIVVGDSYFYIYVLYIVYWLLFIHSLFIVDFIGLFIHSLYYSYIGLEYLLNFNLSYIFYSLLHQILICSTTI